MPATESSSRAAGRLLTRLLVIAVAAVAGTVGLSQVAAAAPVQPQATVISNGWTTSAAAATVAAGSTATISVYVTSAATRSGLVDVELYGPGAQVLQRFFDGQSFTAGVRQTFTVSWNVPAGQSPATYSVKVGIFGAGWTGLLHWNDSAATFAVAAPGATTTTRPATTTTQPATTTTRPATTTTQPATTTTRPATTTTQPATTTTRPATTTTRPSTQHFGTLPVGASLPSDAQCAAAVRPAAEVRPSNSTSNATKGYDLRAQGGLYARVTGNFTGTTDEIIQWAACKWGIDEDIVRAQTAKESWWYQSNAGDWTTDPARCATGHPIGADGRSGQCPESVGAMQVRYPYWTAAFPSATYSTAFNIDQALAARRNCFEGNEGWLNQFERGRNYAAGDIWGCVGLWFSGRWYAGGADEYIAAVQDWYNQRIWETPGFKAG